MELIAKEEKDAEKEGGGGARGDKEAEAKVAFGPGLTSDLVIARFGLLAANWPFAA